MDQKYAKTTLIFIISPT